MSGLLRDGEKKIISESWKPWCLLIVRREGGKGRLGSQVRSGSRIAALKRVSQPLLLPPSLTNSEAMPRPSLAVNPDFSFFVHICCRRVEYDASHCYHDTEYTVATDSTTRPDPTQSHDSHSLGMAYHSAGYRSCSSNDSEL